MNLIIYTPLEDDGSRRLMNAAIRCGDMETKEICNSFENLESRLRYPNFGETIVVLHLTNKKDLSSALSIKDLLHDKKIILILPDRETPTMTQGHTLFPRYVSYADKDFSDVEDVLNKMIANIRRGEKRYCDQFERMETEESEGCLS